MRNPMLRLLLLPAFLLMILSASACHAVIYVWKDAPGPTQDGNSWATAYRYLGNARNDPGATTEEMWVAAGTYNEMVSLLPQMKLYGGFSGTETYREQRDWNTNPTVINPSGGSYAFFVNGTANPSQVTVIDGFTITGANMYGIGVASVPCNILNCKITGNGSSWAAHGVNASGSGVYLRVAGCIIAGNTGTGVRVSGTSSVYISQNTFVDNAASGVETESTSTNVVNNIITGSYMGIHLKSGTVMSRGNCVFGNSSNYWGMEPSQYDISLDPKLKDQAHGDYHLLAGSPCIDSGTGQQEIFNDFDGAYRELDGNGDGIPVVDVGAYEHPVDLLNVKANRADGSQIHLGLCYVTAAFPSLGCIYVERADRSAGIRVKTQGAYAPGDRVNVGGTMRTDAVTGERYVEVSSGVYTVYMKSGQVNIPEPLGMLTRDLVGKTMGLQAGIADAAGLNTIGLRARIFGKVTHADTDFYYIDDGSGVVDGSGYAGVKVLALGTPVPAENSYVSVDGIVSCFKDGANIRRLMLAGGELLVNPDFLAMAGPTPNPAALILGVCFAWNDVTPLPPLGRIEYHIWRDGFRYPVVSVTPVNARQLITPIGTFDHGAGDTQNARQVGFWYPTGDYRLKDFRIVDVQGLVPGTTSRYWISCFYDVGGGTEFRESTPIYMGRATYVPPPTQIGPGVPGATRDIDLSDVVFTWKGSKGADQYRIEVSPTTSFARDQTWCVDVDEKTTTCGPTISRTFTDVLNQSPELSGLPVGTQIFWRIGARNSTDDPGVYPTSPSAQASGAKHTRWIYCNSFLSLRIATGSPPPAPAF